MSDLQKIPKLSPIESELLEATGHTTLRAVAASDPDELFSELLAANRMLVLTDTDPHPDTVRAWISEARAILRLPDHGRVTMPPATSALHQAPAVVRAPTTTEFSRRSAEVQEPKSLDRAPLALPISSRDLATSGVRPSDIPIARIPAIETSSPAQAVKPRERRESLEPPEHSMVQRAGRTSRSAQRQVKPVAIPTPNEADLARKSLIRTTRKETNAGKSPESRRYIRGVLHNQPYRIYFSALISLMLGAMFPLGVIGALLFIASNAAPDTFPWIPDWVLVFPALLPIIAILYLIVALPGGCRICGQKLFIPRKTLKNSKAHHIKVIGYIIPLCFQILLFRWFRCSYCGTPVRLKK